MTAIIRSDTHRAMLCRLSYDAARAPDWPLGARSLPRCFLDRDQDGMPVITIEGTRPDFLGDWRADVDQLDLLIDPTLDSVPHGWGSLMLGVIFRILARFVDDDLALGWNGHSMGASDALIGAALWKLAGRKLGRVTAFEPGPVGKLGRILDGEDVLITRVGKDLALLPGHGDPVPVSTPRGHPGPVLLLPACPGWSDIDCHEMANVAASLDSVLAAA
jgi:hypothetical protein